MENINYFRGTDKHFSKELLRRLDWLRNKEDIKASNDWKKILRKIKNKKQYKGVLMAYNFSKNMNYDHPGLSSNIYFYHPLRVCILSTKIFPKKSPELMTLCLLHNIFETTKINERIVEKIFGNKISKYLKILTVDRKKEWKKGYKKNYYKKIDFSNQNVTLVKIIDKLDNLYLLKNNKNQKIKKRYLEEVQRYILPLVKKKAGHIHKYYENLIKFSKQD